MLWNNLPVILYASFTWHMSRHKFISMSKGSQTGSMNALTVLTYIILNPLPANHIIVPYANSFKSLGSWWDAVSPRSKLFETQTTFSPTLSDIEALWKLKQMRSLADDNLFGGLRVKLHLAITCHHGDVYYTDFYVKQCVQCYIKPFVSYVVRETIWFI